MVLLAQLSPVSKTLQVTRGQESPPITEVICAVAVHAVCAELSLAFQDVGWNHTYGHQMVINTIRKISAVQTEIVETSPFHLQKPSSRLAFSRVNFVYPGEVHHGRKSRDPWLPMAKLTADPNQIWVRGVHVLWSAQVVQSFAVDVLWWFLDNPLVIAIHFWSFVCPCFWSSTKLAKEVPLNTPLTAGHNFRTRCHHSQGVAHRTG